MVHPVGQKGKPAAAPSQAAAGDSPDIGAATGLSLLPAATAAAVSGFKNLINLSI